MITEQQALEAIQRLEITFNIHQRKGDQLAKIWMEEFSNVSESQFKKAINWWIKNHDKFPTIRQLHKAIESVGGPELGKKIEFYEWVDSEDMTTKPVLYYFRWENRIYTCVLQKCDEFGKKPPERFFNRFGLECTREDIWEKERQKEIKKVIEEERLSEEEKRKRLKEIKQKLIKQMEVLDE